MHLTNSIMFVKLTYSRIDCFSLWATFGLTLGYLDSLNVNLEAATGQCPSKVADELKDTIITLLKLENSPRHIMKLKLGLLTEENQVSPERFCQPKLIIWDYYINLYTKDNFGLNFGVTSLVTNWISLQL